MKVSNIIETAGRIFDVIVRIVAVIACLVIAAYVAVLGALAFANSAVYLPLAEAVVVSFLILGATLFVAGLAVWGAAKMVFEPGG